jgi:hypothetical protein
MILDFPYLGRSSDRFHRLNGWLLGDHLIGDNPPVLQADQPIRVGGNLFIMRDDQHGLAALFAQRPQPAHHKLPGFAVERAGRLIAHDDRRIAEQSAGNRDALLLSAGELRRAMSGAVAHAESTQQPARPRFAFFPRPSGENTGQRHIFERRQRWYEMEALKDKANRPPAKKCQLIAAERVQTASGNRDHPRRWAIQPTEQMQQRAFPRSARSHDGDELPRWNVQPNIFQHPQRFAAERVGLVKLTRRDHHRNGVA